MDQYESALHAARLQRPSRPWEARLDPAATPSPALLVLGLVLGILLVLGPILVRLLA